MIQEVEHILYFNGTDEEQVKILESHTISNNDLFFDICDSLDYNEDENLIEYIDPSDLSNLKDKQFNLFFNVNGRAVAVLLKQL